MSKVTLWWRYSWPATIRYYLWRRWQSVCNETCWQTRIDMGPCIIRGKHRRDERGQIWHADGYGFGWTSERWNWAGPTIDLSKELRDDPDRYKDYDNLFEEWPGLLPHTQEK